MTTARTISRTVRPLAAALVVAGALLVAADASRASSTADEPTGCRGLSPASAVDCPPSAFTP